MSDEFLAKIRKRGGSFYIKIDRDTVRKLKLEEGMWVKVKIWKIKIITENQEEEQQEQREKNDEKI